MKSKGYAKGGMKTKGYAKGGMKQGYNDRLDDSMGARNGKKSQSMKARRDESRGMEKSMGNRANSGNKSSAQEEPLVKLATILQRVCCISNHNS